jgi:thiosulfate dehydrogenase [quinone] large subunit
MMAWKVAGYYGADRWVLPMLGTPWHGGTLIHPGEVHEARIRTA